MFIRWRQEYASHRPSNLRSTCPWASKSVTTSGVLVVLTYGTRFATQPATPTQPAPHSHHRDSTRTSREPEHSSLTRAADGGTGEVTQPPRIVATSKPRHAAFIALSPWIGRTRLRSHPDGHSHLLEPPRTAWPLASKRRSADSEPQKFDSSSCQDEAYRQGQLHFNWQCLCFCCKNLAYVVDAT